MAGSGSPLRSLIPAINDMVDSSTAGLKEGKKPQPTEGGAGGSYYMRDASGNRVAVYKPLDEEPNAVNYAGEGIKEETLGRPIVAVTPEGLRLGTKAGKGGLREAAAYRLDHPIGDRRSPSRTTDTFGFAGVPPTTFVTCYSREGGNGPVTAKLGSLQKYIDNTASCILIGPDVYDNFPKDQVHKIAVLDLRLANADRHGGNILRSKSLPAELTPIDHGYCFPARFGGGKFVWLDWPQAEEHFSPETIEYIETLDAQEDRDLLKTYGWDMPLPVARVFCISTMLLKKGAKKNLMPYDIGKIMCRSNSDEKSVIEEIVEKVEKESESSGKDEAGFLEAVSDEMDRRLGEIGTRS